MFKPHTIFAVLLAVSVVSATHSCAEEVDAVKQHRNLTYAEVDGHTLQLDLHVPVVDGDVPLLVWIHGGGWRGGSRRSPKLQAMTKHGFAVASISYRLTDKAIFPAQIHDCKAAIRWLRAQGKDYGVNPEWIAVAGSSAGGHLALLMGVSGDVADMEGKVGQYLDQSSTVQAVIDYFGPADFVLRGETQPERAYTDKSGSFALMGGAAGKRLDPEVERRASPSTYVSADDPPLLIFHGLIDTTVLLDQSQRIVQCYTDAGLVAKLVVLPKRGHGGAEFYKGEHFKTAKDFLHEHLPSSE